MTDLVLPNPCKKHFTIGDGNSLRDSMESKSQFAVKLTAAAAEIGETKEIKDQCLRQLKEWINQNSDIENLLTDDNYLLRFLRITKFSLFLTQQMILKYLNFRRKFLYYKDLLDFDEEKVNELMTNGFIFASPFRDTEGRRVIIYNSKKFDLQRYVSVDLTSAIITTYEAVVEDDETQILGVNHVADLAGVSLAFVSLFTVTEFSRLITWGEASFPMRHRAINFLNVPSPVKYIYEFALSKMSKKITQRVVLHDSLATITEKVDKKCLPLEFGGVMPMSEMIQLWKTELGEKRARLLGVKKIKLLNDRGIINSQNIDEHTPNSDLEGVTGTFRKLEVD